MRGRIRSALCAVAGMLTVVGAAHAAGFLRTSFDAASLSTQDSSGPISAHIDLNQSLALPSLSYGPPDARRQPVPNFIGSIALVPGVDLQLGYKIDLTGRVTSLDVPAYSGLFFTGSALNAPYATLANGGDFVGVTAALANDLHLTFGGASLAPGYSTFTADAASALARVGGQTDPFDLRAATSLLGSLTWDIGKWTSLGINASQTAEHGGVLGAPVAGINSSTNALGVSARVSFGDGWVTTASYSEGITQLDIKPGFSPSLVDSLHTRSYGIAIAKNGLFGDDALGLAVSRPAFGAYGGTFTTTPSVQGRPQFFSRTNLLAGTTPETDIELGYVTTFLDGSIALQTNAAYQMNFAGRNGATAVSLLSRARIKF